jgi:hypothetical protein
MGAIRYHHDHRCLRARRRLTAVLPTCIALAAACGNAAPARNGQEQPAAIAATAAPATALAAPPAGSLPGPRLTAFGTAHQLVVEAADQARRWAVVCQAREDTNGDSEVTVLVGNHGDMLGDDMVPYFFAIGHEEMAIDALVAASPTGSHVVFVRQGRLVLHTAATGAQEDLSALGADARDDTSVFGSHRAASFDGAGTRLVYIRTHGKDAARTRDSARGQNPDGTRDMPGNKSNDAVVVVRDLSTGAEVEIDPGPGLLYRAALDERGHWVDLQVVARDTDGTGALEWPGQSTSLSGRHCRGPVASYSVYRTYGDTPERRVAPATGGPALVVPDLARPMGPHLLRRTADGALLLRDGSGGDTELAPAACRARILHGDPVRARLLVVCADTTGPAAATTGPLIVVGKGIHQTLPVTVLVSDEEAPTWSAQRLVAVAGADDTPVVVDMETLATTVLGLRDQVLATHGTALLVYGGRTPSRTTRPLVWRDLARGVTHRLLADVWPLHISDVLQRGRLVMASDSVVDMDTGRLLGRVPVAPEYRRMLQKKRGPLAFEISVDGLVLLDTLPLDDGLPRGPLRWLSPVR